MFGRKGFARAAALCAAAAWAALSFAPSGRGAAGASAHAYAGAPETVRIGLRFNGDGSTAGAVDSAEVSCDAGVVLSCWSEAAGARQLAGGGAAWAQVTVAKHAFSGAYAAAMAPSGAGYAEASALAAALAGQGFPCVAAFSSAGWNVMVGGFASEAEASALIEKSLRPAYPAMAYAAVATSGSWVSVSRGGQALFALEKSAGALRASGAGGAAVSLGAKKYRGALEFSRRSGSDMTVVNVVPLDQYLYGVVPREIGASAPAEAQKAQAVAARTFAVATAAQGKHQSLGFDLCDGTNCQAYGGVAWESAQSSQAVDQTAGQVLTWQGAPAEAYYFASSGGHTESAANVWGTDVPYLKGVEDPYESQDSEHYSWQVSYTLAELGRELSSRGIAVGEVASIAVTARSAAGRVTEVTVTGSAGAKVLKNDRCRTFLSGLYSTNYAISGGGGGLMAVGASGAPQAFQAAQAMAVSASGYARAAVAMGGKAAPAGVAVSAAPALDGAAAVSAAGASAIAPSSGDKVVITGKGWGHGVGMSQEGAMGMARQGYGYQEILLHYYSGCQVS